MSKVAIVVFSDTEAHADRARVTNAMVAVREFKDNNDDVRLIFDGAGVKWIAELAKPESRSYGLYEAVKDKVTGACSLCAAAFGAKEAILASGIPLLDEYAHHPSLRKLVFEGFQVLIL